MSDPKSRMIDAGIPGLIDAVIDGVATEAEQQKLEGLLKSDPAVMDECARRLFFHAELAESVRPLRVELIHKRHIVIDGEGTDRQVLFRETRESRIGGRENVIALPERPEATNRASRKGIGFILSTVVLAGALIAYQSSEKQIQAIAAPAEVDLRNKGFEDDLLVGNRSAFSETIQDWDDFFPCPNAGVYDVERWYKGRFSAHSGRNAVGFDASRPGWVTQRLRLKDGTSLLARRGMVLQVHGWAYLDASSPEQESLEVSIRHVASTHPAMVQYVAASADLGITGGFWQPFTARLELPSPSLVTEAKHKDGSEESAPTVDLEGKPLTVSIDSYNLGSVLLLDDVSVELVDQKATPAHGAPE